MTERTIVLKGRGILKEAQAAEAITPGMLVARDPTGKAIKHNVAGGDALPAFARENDIFGKGVDTAYAANDQVLYEVLPPGSEVYTFLAAGETALIESKLVSNGAGVLKVQTVAGFTNVISGAVKDSDDAATDGVAVYVHIDEKAEGAAPIAHLESVTAGDANTHFAIGNAGPLVRVLDDDAAATGGLALYFDEDATNEDERFMFVSPIAKDVFIFDTAGHAIRIKHDADAATKGVAVYCDDDADNVHERLLFVSPTNANGAYKTDDVIGLRAIQGAETVVAVALEAVNNSAGQTPVRLKAEVR
jgi:hypothetical protein